MFKQKFSFFTIGDCYIIIKSVTFFDLSKTKLAKVCDPDQIVMFLGVKNNAASFLVEARHLVCSYTAGHNPSFFFERIIV